jgi:cob(I)alamin adenosyltransferase
MSIRINKVYTRSGDAGDTRLVGGQKVGKDSLRIDAYGTVDELNAIVGLVREGLKTHPHDAARSRLDLICGRVQNELFNLGSDLATLPADRHPQQPVIEDRHVLALEHEIDAINDGVDGAPGLPELRSFVLPGGGAVSANLHLARTVCRRAERLVVGLGRVEEVSPKCVEYLNRLSDALFVFGRYAAVTSGQGEVLWTPETT